MNHGDHVNLLRPAHLAAPGSWADLGAGTGAFTLALRELLGPGATIYAVDKNAAALGELARAYSRRFGDRDSLQVLRSDISAALGLPPLDGVLMANSLHFFPDKPSMLRHVRGLLKPGGRLLIVEYNGDHGNAWVPFPLSFKTFKALATQAGFQDLRLLATHASSFLREIYAAAATRPSGEEGAAPVKRGCLMRVAVDPQHELSGV